jgi:hypothetical protein
MATDKVGSGDTALSSMYAQMKQMGATGAGFAGVIMDTEKKTDPNAVVGKQSLVVEKDGVFYALGGKKPLKLESKDPEAAKEEARTKIKEGSLSDLAALSFDNITKKKMAGSQDGGAGSETPQTGTATTGADGKPVAGAKRNPVELQAAKKAKWEEFMKTSPQNFVDIQDKNGKPAKIIIGTDDGKSYYALDSKFMKLPLKLATSQDAKKIYEENKADIDKAIKEGGFGEEEPVVTGATEQPNVNTAGVQQGASSPEAPAGAPPVVTPASMPGRAANGAANYTETGAGAPTETTLPAEGGTPPAATPVTGQPAPVGA